MSVHSSFLQPSAIAGAVCPSSYITHHATIHSVNSRNGHIPTPATTLGKNARRLAPTVTQFVTIERRSWMPRVLIDMARRRGMEAVAFYYDAGLSTQVLA